MKKRPPARALRRARQQDQESLEQLAAYTGTRSRSFSPEEPSKSDVSGGTHFRGVAIEDWKLLEARMTQQRALRILQSHPGYCKCSGCQSFAPRAAHSVFFRGEYDPLAV